MKKILSLLLVALMLVGMLPMMPITANAASAGDSVSYTFSSYTAGTQYATNEEHVLDSDVTVVTTECHFTTQLRIYSSSTHDGYAIIKCTNSDLTFSGLNVNAGNKVDTLNVYGSNDEGAAWTLIQGVSVTSTSYNDYPVSFAENYQWLKLDVAGAQQVRVAKMTLSFAAVNSGECAHTNTENIEAVAATCTTAGNTAGVKCTDCGVVLSGNETIAALGHTNDEGVVTAATCTTDGYTLYTCTVCGSTKKDNYVEATGHNYVDGVCSVCTVAMPTELDGKYYIAAIRSSGNYMYMTNDLGTADTKRYQIVDSGVTELPANITNPVDAQVFELVFDASAATYKIKTGTQYLGWTSGNSGALVDETSAIAATIEYSDVEGAYLIHFTASDAERYLALNSNAANAYFAWYKQGQAEDLYLVPVVESEDTPCTQHNYVDGVCTICGATDESDVDTPDATEPDATEPEATEPTEEVKITFELGADGTATHDDGDSATTYTETVDGYTLDITGGTKMYTGAIDATGNGCIKLGTSSAVGGFTFTVPTDVTQVVICVAKYKDKTSKVNINGTDYTLTQNSNDGAYDEIEVDTSSSKTVNVTTVSGGVRAMVNSITFVCGETSHTCQWDEGTVTTAATCTTDGVKTYSCTVDGCTITKTEKIEATGHTYTYEDGSVTCTCGDTQAISPISDAKAYTSTSTVYYVKGIVTYVSGKNVYIEDATGGICVYFATAPSDIALGDEIVVWDTMTTYNGLIETTNTTAQEYLKVSSGNALPSQTVTLADLLADTTNEYLGERVVIENVTIGVLGTNNTALTDADGNTINIYKAPALNTEINENDIVTVTAIVSTYNAYQLFVNSADDVVEIQDGTATVIETVSIATAKAGTAGEYYQVEGIVTYISGRNVYIQDATGAIVVYLTADAAATQVGDKVKAYGALKLYNGLIELDAVDETNTQFYEILTSGNTVDAQEVTIEGLLADTTNEYLAEKVTLTGVYVSYNSYNSSYGNVSYTLIDGNGNTIQIYRVTVASEEECVAGGSIVNVEAIVSSYNGYRLITTNDKIVVTGTCAHETTELVNASAATCTEAGYTGDTQCTVCKYYVTRGEEIPALGHTEIGVANSQPTCQQVGYTSGVYCTVCETYTSGHEEIPVIDHIISGTITPPTCTEQGYTTYACYMCGLEEKVDNYVDPTGHQYENGVCTVCGEPDPNYQLYDFVSSLTVALDNNIALRFIVDPDLNDDGVLELEGNDNIAVFYRFNKATAEWYEAGRVGQADWESYSKNRFTAAFDIAAKEMTDEVKIVIVNADGVPVSNEYIDSARAYGMRGVNSLFPKAASNAKTAKQLTMFVDFLNYGAAAQTQFIYNTGDLANAQLTADHQAYATESAEPENLRTGHGSSQVSVEDRIELSFLLDQTTVTSDMYVVISYTHHNGTVESVTIQGTDFETYTNKSGTRWSVLTPNIATPDGNQLITCVVYSADGNEVTRAVDSVNSYMARVLSSSSAGESLKDLATAAVKLTTSSYNYFHA